MNCGIVLIFILRFLLLFEVFLFEYVFIENNLSDKYRKMYIYLLCKIDWLKNFFNFYNLGC